MVPDCQAIRVRPRARRGTSVVPRGCDRCGVCASLLFQRVDAARHTPKRGDRACRRSGGRGGLIVGLGLYSEVRRIHPPVARAPPLGSVSTVTIYLGLTSPGTWIEGYLRAASAWQAVWPEVTREIERMPLPRAHEHVVARALGTLPFDASEAPR